MRNLMIDNTSVVAYLNKLRMVSQSLCQLTQEIIIWMELQTIENSARYILECKNVMIAHLSCHNQLIPQSGHFFLGYLRNLLGF